jgi:putative hydrolase of the HAD superfamily
MKAAHAELPLRVDGAFRYSRPWFRRFIADVFRRLGQRELPPALPAELFDRFARAETFRVFDDVEPALQALAARGLRLGVVSNWSDSLPELLRRLGIGELLDPVVASANAGFEKPDPRIFGIALERAGVAAGEAAHVGDQPLLDVAGATAAGISPILLDREGAHGGFAGRRIGSLAALAPLLEAENGSLA